MGISATAQPELLTNRDVEIAAISTRNHTVQVKINAKMAGKILSRMDEIVDALIDRAVGYFVEEDTPSGRVKYYKRDPDTKAAIYLMDRVYGRPKIEIENTGNPLENRTVVVLPAKMSIEDLEELPQFSVSATERLLNAADSEYDQDDDDDEDEPENLPVGASNLPPKVYGQ